MNKQTIIVNGDQQEVVSFIPQLTGELAIVDLNTLQRLAAMLPQANFKTIQGNLIEALQMSRNIQELVSVMKNEVAFHETVNIIKTYEHNQIDMSQMH